MERDFEITEAEMMTALKKLGYLLESEMVKKLMEFGFFVEPNQVIKDPITGKSREIDITAEYYEYIPKRAKHNVCSKIRFVFEVKNNLFPLVLLTEHSFTPNVEEFLALKEFLTIPLNIEYNAYDAFYERIIGKGTLNIALSQKRNPMMN